MATGPGTPPGGIPHRGGIYCSIANKLIASARPPARQCPVGLETPFLLELRPHPHAQEQGRGEDRRADHNNGAEGGGHLQPLGEGLLGRCHELGCQPIRDLVAGGDCGAERVARGLRRLQRNARRDRRVDFAPVDRRADRRDTALSLDVLTLDGPRATEVTSFVTPYSRGPARDRFAIDVLERSGLPARLD
jgi:hypothetical protein